MKDLKERITYSPHCANKFRVSGSNTVLEVYSHISLYYSYSTVIGFIFGRKGFITTKRYSVSTSKHQTFCCGHMHDKVSEVSSLPDNEFRALLDTVEDALFYDDKEAIGKLTELLV